jgi:two-component system NtrC family sensor kinase
MASGPASKATTQATASARSAGLNFGMGSRLIGLLAVLALALAVLLWGSLSGSGAGRGRLTPPMTELRQLDADLSMNVLRARSDITKGYDAIDHQAKALAKASQQLRLVCNELDDPQVNERVARLEAAVKRKLEQVETFKRENSQLRDALQAFPEAALNLLDYMARAGSPQTETRGYVGDLMSIMFTQYLDAGTSQRAAITAYLDPLAAAAGDAKGKLPDLVRATVSQGRSVLAHKDREVALLTDMGTTQIPSHLSELQQALDVRLARDERVGDFSRWALGAMAAVLLGLLVLAARRIMRAHRTMSELNVELAHTNESLEARVQTRTADLQNALRDLKESQSHLVQSEKMASLGQMVAGIAHEINTPLAYVNSGLQSAHARLADVQALVGQSATLAGILQSSNEPSPSREQVLADWLELVEAFTLTDAVGELQTQLDDGRHGIEQISEMVRNLKDFSRLDRSRLGRFDLNDGVRATLKIANNVVKHHRVDAQLGPLPQIQCSPSQINQVLLNLVSNAAQATPEGGLIEVRTYATPTEVVVEVRDEGSGIPPDVLPHIFDPFFTTKKVGEGTGLGLSIVHRIISEHGGRIEVDTEPTVGTQFKVSLPQEQPAALAETTT